jgi:hypothetical protein
MRRSKKDKGFVTPTGWTITEAGRRSGSHYMRERRARRSQSLVWVLRLLIALAVLVAVSPYLHDEDLGGSLIRLLDYRSAAPVNPGNQNGLLRK